MADVAAPTPPFRATSTLADLYDLTTYYGRLQYNWRRMNPLQLRWSAVEIAQANATLAAYDRGDRSRSDSELWRAAEIREVTCAPGSDGAMTVPWFFRQSGWALGGTPGIAFLVFSAARWPTSLSAVAFGQWANQTHLAGCTYCNSGVAKASPEFGPRERDLLTAYLLACATAVPVAFAAAIAARRFARPLQPFAPYPGVAAANAIGCLAMRRAQYEEGIDVRPADGTPAAPPPPPPRTLAQRMGLAAAPEPEVACGGGSAPLGQSRAAGWVAVRDTAATRLVLPLGNFVGVPLILGAASWLRGGVRSPLVAQVGVTAAVFSLWMPVGAALYPPTGRLPLADVEAEIAARAPPGCTAVVYERGA